jgi:hypothetical protein
MPAPLPRGRGRPVHHSLVQEWLRVSLVIAAALPPLAGEGFAEAAGSVPDARCRAPAAPGDGATGAPPRWGMSRTTRGLRLPLGPIRGGAVRRRPACARPFGENPNCVAVRGARVPAGPRLSSSRDGVPANYFQVRNEQPAYGPAGCRTLAFCTGMAGAGSVALGAGCLRWPEPMREQGWRQSLRCGPSTAPLPHPRTGHPALHPRGAGY